MIYINITNFVINSKLKKNHSMIERHPLKNVKNIRFESELTVAHFRWWTVFSPPEMFFRKSVLKICSKFNLHQ